MIMVLTCTVGVGWNYCAFVRAETDACIGHAYNALGERDVSSSRRGRRLASLCGPIVNSKRHSYSLLALCAVVHRDKEAQ